LIAVEICLLIWTNTLKVAVKSEHNFKVF